MALDFDPHFQIASATPEKNSDINQHLYPKLNSWLRRWRQLVNVEPDQCIGAFEDFFEFDNLDEQVVILSSYENSNVD